MHISQRVLALALCAGLLAACAKKDEGAELTTDAQKFGYAIGVDLGKSLQPVKGDVDVAALKRGVDDVLAGVEPKLNDAAREEIKTAVVQKLQQKMMEERVAKGAKAKEDGDKFLAENAKKPGVKTTASGLQYEVVQEGTGASPKPEDIVTVQYRGSFLSGEEFDSSYSHGQPATFELGGVLPGWREGLQFMKVGGKSKLYIPYDLAYGEQGQGQRIGPNETLVFEVELLNVEKQPQAKKK